jgi:hypothetical protein
MMIEVQFDSGRCQILRDGQVICNLSAEEAEIVRDQLVEASKPE